MRKMIPIVLALAAALPFSVAAQSQTLKTVQDRGALICGVNPDLEGFASKDANGQWSGFDVDFCRAVAAAIFNDPSKVQYVPLSASDRFEALKNKQIDVLSRNSTWTMGREGDNGVVFTGVTYFDGQAFLVPKSQATSNRRSNSTAARSACSPARRPSPISSTILKPTI